ncbi:phage virion morphogenesis protein [Vandammella animalimorsus]|uniref:phage virion morphogenesis protein n=1 Tax=Vandammella animalimorsus TaxID=2029117 RepID=UPI0026F66DB0|nr:phage virion morphogenesis protein [Comamonadaceae bacterium]
MLQINIRWDNQSGRALDALLDRMSDLRPALKEIGEELAHSTKQRFVTATDPDGNAWEPNADTTLLRYGMRYRGNGGRKGQKRAAERIASKKPLTGESRQLARTIGYQVQNATTVAIGSPMIYAATQQFGAEKGAYGYSRRGPIPWGKIPARPFLGVSAQDRQNILDILQQHLKP